MADITPHGAAQLNALPATPPDLGSSAIKVCIRPYKLDFWEYEGTRALLEAEGVIPPGTEWPEGTHDRRWEAGRFSYWLRRCRPDGMKGPKNIWSSGDYWCLRCDLIDGPPLATRRIREKRAELAAELYWNSAAGQRESNARWDMYLKASKDKAFQRFKALVLPERKPKAQASKARSNGDSARPAGGAA